MEKVGEMVNEGTTEPSVLVKEPWLTPVARGSTDLSPAYLK
jgi:hypothetical protein